MKNGTTVWIPHRGISGTVVRTDPEVYDPPDEGWNWVATAADNVLGLYHEDELEVVTG